MLGVGICLHGHSHTSSLFFIGASKKATCERCDTSMTSISRGTFENAGLVKKYLLFFVITSSLLVCLEEFRIFVLAFMFNFVWRSPCSFRCEYMYLFTFSVYCAVVREG